MHVPAAGEHVRDSRAAHEARKIAVTAADLLHRAARQHHHVGWLDPRARLERELALARTVFDFERTQRQTKPHDIAAQNFEYGIELVVTQFSEMLIALREETDLGRRPGLAGIVERKPRVFELENMKCHFEPRHVVETGFAQPLQRAPVQIASRDGNRLAAGEIQIAQQPSRAYSPRQDMERGWVGNNDYVGGRLHVALGEAGAAQRQNGRYSVMRGVLRQQCHRESAALAHHPRQFASDHRLAAQHSMLIGKREPDDFQLVRLDKLLDLVRGFRPLVGPQTMTFDETHCAPSVRMRHSLFKDPAGVSFYKVYRRPGRAFSAPRVEFPPIRFERPAVSYAIERDWTADTFRGGLIQDHQRPLAFGRLFDCVDEDPPIDRDSLVRRAEMLLRAVLDWTLRLD